MIVIILLLLVALAVWVCLDLFFGYKRSLSKTPTTSENVYKQSHIEFFTQGDKWFDHMLQHIDQAQDHIHMNFYIFRDDNIGKKVLHGLKEKAKKGVTVRLMVDWLAHKISKKEQKALQEAGIQFAKDNRPSFPFFFYSLNERNHRKIVVIDGKYGYVGGYNVGDEYLGRDPEMGRWRDYHLFVEGESVGDLQKLYLSDWQSASNERIDYQKMLQLSSPESTVPLKIVATNGSPLEEFLHELLEEAQFFVFIGTPYFIPGKKLHNKLIELARRGVKVQVIIPKYPDHPLVKDAAYPYFPELIKAGVEIRQFYEGFFHAKVINIDNRLIDLGTANFDKRSLWINKEVNCVIADKTWIKPVKEEIEKDFYESAETITLHHISKRSVWERGKEKIATLLSPFL